MQFDLVVAQRPPVGADVLPLGQQHPRVGIVGRAAQRAAHVAGTRGERYRQSRLADEEQVVRELVDEMTDVPVRRRARAAAARRDARFPVQPRQQVDRVHLMIEDEQRDDVARRGRVAARVGRVADPVDEHLVRRVAASREGDVSRMRPLRVRRRPLGRHEPAAPAIRVRRPMVHVVGVGVRHHVAGITDRVGADNHPRHVLRARRDMAGETARAPGECRRS